MFFTIGRPLAGIACLLLQLTIIGWPFAIMWAIEALDNYEAERKIKKSSRCQGETIKKDDQVKNTGPARRSGSKMVFWILAVMILVFLAMDFVTSHKTGVPTSPGEKDRDSKYGYCGGLHGHWIGGVDFGYRDFCAIFDPPPSYNPKTDEWTVTVRAKRPGVLIDVVDFRYRDAGSVGMSIPFRRIDVSPTVAQFVLRRHGLGRRTESIEIQAGNKLPYRRLFGLPAKDGINRHEIIPSKSASCSSVWLRKTFWQDLASEFIYHSTSVYGKGSEFLLHPAPDTARAQHPQHLSEAIRKKLPWDQQMMLRGYK
jgi:hypothetical protein